MTEVFIHRHTVRPDEIDALGHANNVCYIQWMQDAALAHSAALGWPAERYRATGCGWVVREHGIRYRRPLTLGDEVALHTWVAVMKRVTSLRQFRFEAGGETVAEAETNWAFIDYATGQPTRIPPEIASAFPLLAVSEPGPD